jgi:hypothetical protein
VSTTRFAAAVTALLAAYTAAAPLAGIPVYDGAQVSGASDPKFIIVGHDGTIAADGTLTATAPAGNYVQAWADTTTGREENGWINCVAVTQTGEAAGLADCRTGTDALLAAAEDAAAAGGAPHLTFDGTTDGRIIYRQGPNGAAVICAYRVTYSAPWG